MRWIFTALFLFSLNAGFSQLKLDGQWEGTITKDLYAGSEVFQFKLLLFVKEDGTVVGETTVSNGKIYASMDIEAEISGDVVYFKETKIYGSKEPEKMEWCLKNAHLQLVWKDGQPYLEGIWRGYTSFKSCSPGKISLWRPIARP
jgi:hypothetical protein